MQILIRSGNENLFGSGSAGFGIMVPNRITWNMIFPS